MLQTKDLKNSGKSQSGNLYTYILRVSQMAVDVVTNCSKVQVQAILTQSITGTGFSNWGTGVSCALNGEQIFSDYAQRRISGTKEHVFYTWEGQLPHLDDGTLALTVEGRLWQNSAAAYTPPELAVQGQVELTPIARASTVHASSGNIEETVLIAVSKKNERFTHTLAYRFGMEEGFVDDGGNAVAWPVRLSAVSCGFRLPESFYDQIPDDPSGQCELICTTFDGDAQVGQPQSCFFTATAEKGRCQPVLTGTVKDVNPKTLALTGDENVLIRYASTALCTVAAEPKNGAGMEQVLVEGVETALQQSLQIPNTEKGSFSFWAVDTRGYEARLQVDKALIPYVKLTCNPKPGRTDPASGVAQVLVEGSCYCGHFGAAENTLQLYYGMAGEQLRQIPVQILPDHSYSVVLEIPDLDYTQNYELQLHLQDGICTVDTTARIGQAIPVFDWGKNHFRSHVPLTAVKVNDRGICQSADEALLPGTYRIAGEEGVLLVFAAGESLAQLHIAPQTVKSRLIIDHTACPWAAL